MSRNDKPTGAQAADSSGTSLSDRLYQQYIDREYFTAAKGLRDLGRASMVVPADKESTIANYRFMTADTGTGDPNTRRNMLGLTRAQTDSLGYANSTPEDRQAIDARRQAGALAQNQQTLAEAEARRRGFNNALPTFGGMALPGLAMMLSGGTSLPVSLGLAAIGAGSGSIAGQYANDKRVNPATVGKDIALQGVAPELVGQGLGLVGRKYIAPQLMRQALPATKKFSEDYADILQARRSDPDAYISPADSNPIDLMLEQNATVGRLGGGKLGGGGGPTGEEILRRRAQETMRYRAALLDAAKEKGVKFSLGDLLDDPMFAELRADATRRGPDYLKAFDEMVDNYRLQFGKHDRGGNFMGWKEYDPVAFEQQKETWQSLGREARNARQSGTDRFAAIKSDFNDRLGRAARVRLEGLSEQQFRVGSRQVPNPEYAAPTPAPPPRPADLAAQAQREHGLISSVEYAAKKNGMEPAALWEYVKKPSLSTSDYERVFSTHGLKPQTLNELRAHAAAVEESGAALRPATPTEPQASMYLDEDIIEGPFVAQDGRGVRQLNAAYQDLDMAERVARDAVAQRSLNAPSGARTAFGTAYQFLDYPAIWSRLAQSVYQPTGVGARILNLSPRTISGYYGATNQP